MGPPYPTLGLIQSSAAWAAAPTIKKQKRTADTALALIVLPSRSPAVSDHHCNAHFFGAVVGIQAIQMDA
jgi:hypothetical protein